MENESSSFHPSSLIPHPSKKVDELLEELFVSGGTPEEVCRAYPELLSQVRAGWERLCAVETEVDALFPHSTSLNGAGPSALLPAELPRIRGYEMQGILGRGGMGVVYKAWHLRLNRAVAVKMLLAGVYARTEELERFLREAEAVAGLRHVNVVQVHDVGDLNGQPYFTMEFVEGGSLAQKLAGMPQPAGQAAALVATVAEAIQMAHSSGVIHRDLTPANILLTADGTPKITDFGLARRMENGGGLTLSGATLGTPSYMAPEQAQGQKGAIGPGADVYALGAILYELLTGRPPFRAETAAATLQQVLAEDPAPPSRLNSLVPRDLETICLKCLHKEPPRRYASAAALAEDLHRFGRGEPIVARPVGPLERGWRWCRRNPREAALAGLALLAMLLVGSGLWWSDRQRTKRHAEQILQEARTRRGAEGLLDQAKSMRRQAHWAQAKEVLEQAALVIGDEGPEDLRRQLQQAQRDLPMAEKLDGICQAKVTIVDERFNTAQAPPAYAREFSAYGLAISDGSVTELAERIRGSEIKQELIDALDDWIFLEPSELVGKLAAVASAADPAPWRDQVRHAVAARNVAALARLAEEAPPAEQSVRLLAALGWQLSSTGQKQVAIALLGAGNVGLLTSPASAGPLLAALARISAGTDSVRFLRRLQQEYPADFWVNFTLGNALATTDPGEAVGYYRAALAIRPTAFAVHSNLGIVLKNMGRINESIALFRRAVQIDPNNVPARDSLGIVLTIVGRPDEAIDHFRQALKFEPKDAKVYFDLGVSLQTKGRLDDAIDSYRRALQIDSRFAPAHDYLGVQLLSMGRIDDAIDHLQQAVRIDSRFAEAHKHLGVALANKGRINDSIDHFEQALHLNPQDAMAHGYLGKALVAQGRIDKAIDQFGQALRINSEDAMARGALGVALMMKGRTDEAIDHFERALRTDPKDAITRGNLGNALATKGRIDDAVSQLRQAVALQPKHASMQKRLRTLLMRQGRVDEVRIAWGNALEANPPEHDAWYGYAELCLFLGHEDEYRRARQALLARFGTTNDPATAERTGRACLLLPATGDELHQAVILAERAAAADRSKYAGVYAHFLFVQGLAEYRQGQFERAMAAMRGDAARVLGPAPRLVLAMALHRNGQAAEARNILASAILAHDWSAAQVRDQDGWIYHALRREAERLILPDLPAFLAGKHKPQDNDERLALLGVCQFKDLRGAAAALHAESFANDPNLAENLQAGHRYNAARAAAVAGCGACADGAKSNEEERERWRKQACAWLRADLKAWTKKLDTGTSADRVQAQKSLSHWRDDPDLAGLRDQDALDKLPPAERQECRTLWRNVEALIER